MTSRARHTAWHTCDDGARLLMFVQRVDYSPFHKWEAEPVRGGNDKPPTSFARRTARTRADAMAAAADALREGMAA